MAQLLFFFKKSKYMRTVFTVILLNVLFALSVTGQTIETAFPTQLTACSADIPLDVTITNDGSSAIDPGMITFDLSGHPNIMIDSIDTGSSDMGVTLTGNVVSFSNPIPASLSLWINEFHYRNQGQDQNEFVEIFGPAGLDLTKVQLVKYNGNGGTTYGSIATGVGTISDEGGTGFGTYVFNNIGNVQNAADGNGDGFALIYDGEVVQFLSYGASFTATNGPANGLTSTDVGVIENNNSPASSSIELENGTWIQDDNNSSGSLNPMQQLPSTNSNELTFQLHLSQGCQDATVANPEIVLTLEYGSPATTVMHTVSGYTIATPTVDIAGTTMPNAIKAAIGTEFMVTSTVSNTSTVSIDSVYYCVNDNMNADILNVVVNGVTIESEASSPAGFTCFNVGALAANGMVDVKENWVFTSCNAPIENLRREVSFGCKGSFDCDPADTNPSAITVLSQGDITDPLTITLTNNPNVATCGPTEKITVNIANNNDDQLTLKNVKICTKAFTQTIPPTEITEGINFDKSSLMLVNGNAVSYIPGTDTILLGDLLYGESTEFMLNYAASCLITENSFVPKVEVKYDELCEGEQKSQEGEGEQVNVLAPELSILPGIQGNLRPAQNIYDPILGETDTLKVPLVNAGQGPIDTFVYYVINNPVVESRGAVVAGESLEVIRTSGDTTFYAVSHEDILRYQQATESNPANQDGVLDQNQPIVICELWEAVLCVDTTVPPIKRQAYFGCDGIERCSESNESTTGTDSGFAIPDLKYSLHEPFTERPAC